MFSSICYQLVDKNIKYTSEIRFGYNILNEYKEGDKVIYKGKYRTLSNRNFRKYNSILAVSAGKNFIAIATSQTFLYQLLSSEMMYRDSSDFMANHLINVLKLDPDQYEPITTSDLNNLSTNNYRTLKRLSKKLINKSETNYISLLQSSGNLIYTLRSSTPIHDLTELILYSYYDVLIQKFDGEQLIKMQNLYDTETERKKNLEKIVF